MLEHKIYRESLSLLTDLYQLTMAYGYWKAGLQKKEAVFHLFFRRPPFNGGFTVAAGLENAVNFIENLSFKQDDLDYLAELKNDNDTPLFSEPFLTYLSKMKFSCDLDAVPEGTVMFPYEPLLRTQGPLIQCQLLESPLLNLINFPTLIATKAARICLAAQNDPIIEFGMRRAQGIDGALTASRASYIGGCIGTSNVLAGKVYGIPVKGTHAHSWVLVFDSELESFKTYAEAMPDNCVFLVDTFNSIEGVHHAIEVGKWLRERGKPFLGIRLDSGDLADLSIRCRKLLDDAGFHDTKILASNELDETIIGDLKRQGAKIGVWGVGTHLVTAKGHSALDGVYKLSAIRTPDKEWEYKLKLSEQMSKVSNPGILQVKRFSSNGHYFADMIHDTHLTPQKPYSLINPFDPTHKSVIDKGTEYNDLLIPIFKNGKKVYDLPSLDQIRAHTQNELSLFPEGIKRFLNPHIYPVGMELQLYNKRIELIENARNKEFTRCKH